MRYVERAVPCNQESINWTAILFKPVKVKRNEIVSRWTNISLSCDESSQLLETNQQFGNVSFRDTTAVYVTFQFTRLIDFVGINFNVQLFDYSIDPGYGCVIKS